MPSNTVGVFTFDGPNKIIQLASGTTQFNAVDLYSSWKQWLVDHPENLTFPTAFANSVGGESLGGGVLIGSYFFIQNGWLVRPQNIDHALVIDGNLIPVPDTAAIFASTIDSHQVVISMRSSSLTQQVLTNTTTTISGEGLTKSEFLALS